MFKKIGEPEAMEIGLKYGGTTQPLKLEADDVRVAVLTPKRTAPTRDGADLIRSALANPIGIPQLPQLVRPGHRVVIATSDITRPCPSARLLPPLLHELNRAGIPDTDITVVFGLGIHRGHTAEERERLVGSDVYRRVRCIDPDPADAVHVGTTRRGTPVEVFRPVVKADFRIGVGVIEYHYFVGYSGGVKAYIPGVCTATTIQHNHRRMTEPGAAAGNLDGNPVRDDLEEAGELIGVHFILNAVLDETRCLVAVVAGHPRQAHRAGCAALDAFGRDTVEEPADIVVVSAGGFPKDINVYQAQKALDNARRVVRKGGILLLVAECREGLGDETFEAWMKDPGGPDAILGRIRREFVLGGHKAAAVAMAMQQASIYFVSSLEAEYARSLGFSPFSDVNAAMEEALKKVGPNPSILVLPEGGSVLPSVGKAGKTT